jgi:hypothetical protein
MQLLHQRAFALLLINLAITEAAPMGTSAISGAPTDAQARLLSTSYSGSGCPQGSASNGFDGITAQIGPNVPISKSTQNCELQLSIQTAPGWRFVVRGKNAGTTSMTARVNLQDGVAASSITTYNVAGVNSQVSNFKTKIGHCLTPGREQYDTIILVRETVKPPFQTLHLDRRIPNPTVGEEF